MRKQLLLLLCCLLPLFVSAQYSASTTAAAPAQTADSLYQYVNATSLTLRTLPNASSAATARIAGGSRVLVLHEGSDGWSQVQVAAYTGYVKAEYLIDEQTDITAEIDWTSVSLDGGYRYASVAPVSAATGSPTRPTAYKAAPKVAAGPKVYICGNGRTEVYHTTEGCSAMRRCTYQTLTMSESQARSTGLRGCMKCN